MKILIDTNVLLNFITQRDDNYLRESMRVMELCANEDVQGYLAFHSLSTIWYVLRRQPDEIRRDWIKQLCQLLTVAWADNKAVLTAAGNTKFADFEDALQDCCAAAVGAEYIVTGNVKDYDGVSSVKAINPADFILLLESEDRKEENIGLQE